MNCYSRLEHALNQISPLDDEHRAAINDLFTAHTLIAGEHYVRVGESAEAIAFVCSGLFRYFYVDQGGNEHIKTFAREDDFVTSYASLISGEQSAYTVQALEESRLLELDRETYLHGVANDPYWAEIARVYVERLFIAKVAREASLLMDDAAERYEKFVHNHRDLHDRLRLRDIASFLGMTDVTLSRVRARRS